MTNHPSRPERKGVGAGVLGLTTDRNHFVTQLYDLLVSDTSTALRTAVLDGRMRMKPRERAIAFGLIWKRSMMSWLQWDGVVDLISESINQMLGVDDDLCVVPRARQLSALIWLHAPDTTSLEKEGNGRAGVRERRWARS